MNAKTIAAGGLTAGLLLIAWSILHTTADSTEPARSEIGALTSTEPFDGIKPIADVVSFWERRVDAAPDGFLDRTQLGIALAGHARETANLALYAKSEVALRGALRSNPDYLTAKLALAQTLHSQHDFSEARDIADEVARSEPSSLGALALLGDANFELGNYDIARRHYDDLVEQERSAPVVSRLSRIAYALGEPEQAVTLASEALDLSESLALRPADRAFYSFQLGHFLFNTGDTDGAIEALANALDIAPDSPAAKEQLAFVYASVGRGADAEALYADLLATGPAADLHGSYADLLRARGALVEAERQDQLGLELALATIDRYPAERRHLATFFMTRDAELAVELARDDLAERSDVGAYDTLAWALYYDGRFAEADNAIRAALATGIDDAQMLSHAGVIAAANGDDDRAVAYLTEALRINPQFHPFEAPLAAELLRSLHASGASG